MAAPAITHTKVATLPDQPGVEVNKAEWNGPHALANFTAVSKLLGSGSAAATPDEITLGAGLTMTGTTLEATASATPALSSITAATGAATIASGNNTGIVWNWANTADSTICFDIGETTAATNGTATTNIDNQVLLKVETASGSTQSPFQIFRAGGYVFGVRSSTGQVLFAGGSAGTPPIASVSNNANTTGLFFAANVLGISVTAVENTRFAAGIVQSSKGSADAVAFSYNFRKSRGTVAAPTVITTGDDLSTIKGFGYLGATNTYTEACRITFDSIGTISDSTSGIGGVIRFNTANQGTVGVVEAMTVWNSGDVTIGLPTPATTATIGFPQIPTMSGTPTGVPTVITGFNPMVYDTTGKKIWVYDYGSAAWKGVAVV